MLLTAQAQGQGQLIVAAQSLGTSLFTSSEYSNRNRTNSEFVTDLYAGYLGRSPDSGGYEKDDSGGYEKEKDEKDDSGG